MSKVDLNVVEAIRMAKVVLDPLRQVLDRRHAAQEIVPASLASGLSLFLLLWLPWCTHLRGPLPRGPLALSPRVCSFLPWLLMAGAFLGRWR